VPRSLLLEGILSEDTEAARAQVWAFDHATVAGEVGRGLGRLIDATQRKVPLVKPFAEIVSGELSRLAPSDAVRHARDDNLILPIQPDHWRAAKLGRILSHFSLRFAAEPSEAELFDLCLEAEARAVALLTSAHPIRKGGKDADAWLVDARGEVKPGVHTADAFTGTSVTDLSRYACAQHPDRQVGYRAQCRQHRRGAGTQRSRSIVKHAAIRGAAFKPCEMKLPIGLFGTKLLTTAIHVYAAGLRRRLLRRP
jgi:hypothetical protein